MLAMTPTCHFVSCFNIEVIPEIQMTLYNDILRNTTATACNNQFIVCAIREQSMKQSTPTP